jgi:hypothetical protein
LRFPLLSRNTATLARWTERQPVGGSRWGGAAVVVIGAVALLGWMTGSRTLSAIGRDFIPMAPNTALLVVLLGAGLCAPSKSPWALSYNRVAIALAFLFSASRVAEYLLGINLGVDSWLFSFPSESLGLAPVGKMAFFTALTLMLACIALAGLTVPTRKRYVDEVVRTLGFVVTLVGSVFSLGYLYDAPLLYGGRSIPMALPTAIAFVILGLSIVIPAILRDQTDRRNAERALRIAHDELERRVAERTAALEAVNAGLQRTVTQLEEQTKEAEFARQEVHVAEERYHALVDGLAIGVVLMTPQGIRPQIRARSAFSDSASIKCSDEPPSIPGGELFTRTAHRSPEIRIPWLCRLALASHGAMSSWASIALTIPSYGSRSIPTRCFAATRSLHTPRLLHSWT